jgi:hypothetical protein
MMDTGLPGVQYDGHWFVRCPIWWTLVCQVSNMMDTGLSVVQCDGHATPVTLVGGGSTCGQLAVVKVVAKVQLVVTVQARGTRSVRACVCLCVSVSLCVYVLTSLFIEHMLSTEYLGVCSYAVVLLLYPKCTRNIDKLFKLNC